MRDKEEEIMKEKERDWTSLKQLLNMYIERDRKRDDKRVLTRLHYLLM